MHNNLLSFSLSIGFLYLKAVCMNPVCFWCQYKVLHSKSTGGKRRTGGSTVPIMECSDNRWPDNGERPHNIVCFYILNNIRKGREMSSYISYTCTHDRY